MTDHPTHPPSAALRVAAVAIGGALGAVARTALVEAMPPGDGWPWATFTANMAGTAILAFLFAVLLHPGRATRLWRLLAGTGFCGALTTFSAFQVEAIDLARDGHPGLAAGYVAASLAGGLALAVAAAGIGRRVATA